MSKKMSTSMKLGISSLSLFLASMVTEIALKMSARSVPDCKNDADCKSTKSNSPLRMSLFSLYFFLELLGVHQGKMEAGKSMLIGLFLIVLPSSVQGQTPLSNGPVIESHAQFLIEQR